MTIVKEIEAHVNDRPLAQASETAFKVITPSMLCIGRKLRPWNDKYAETEFPQEQDVRDSVLSLGWRLWDGCLTSL